MLGCSPQFKFDGLQGEWVGDSVSYYLKFSHDSLSYAHTSINLKGSRGGRRITFVDLGFLQPPSPLRPCRVSNDTLYVADSSSQHRKLGFLSLKDSRLLLSIYDGGEPIRFSRLSYDSTVNLTKIQLSLSREDRSQLIHDIELKDSVLLFHGTERSPHRGYFRSPLANENWLAIRDMARKVRFDQHNELYRERARYWKDVPEYGVAFFIDGKVRSFLFNVNDVPPDLIGLVTTVESLTRSSTFLSADTTFWFHSRLALTYSLDDSIEYLEQFDPANYRTAKYPGGFPALQQFLHAFMSSLPDSLLPYDFDVYLDENGHIEKLDISSLKDQYTLPALRIAMLKSRRWQPAMWAGKRVPTKKWVLFHTPTNGLVAG
jgi:hypothetical protein